MWSRTSAKALLTPSSRFAAPVGSLSCSHTIVGTSPVPSSSQAFPRANYAGGGVDKGSVAPALAGIIGSGLLVYVGLKYALSDKDPIPTPPPGAHPGSIHPEKFNAFPLIAKEGVSHDSKIFRFGLPSPDHVLGLPVASCVVVKAPGETPDKPLTRPYTPITKEDQRGYFDLLVKEYEQGKMSKHIHSLKIGDTLEVKGPISKIPYTANMKKNISMIAGGTGITPMYQVLEKILENPNDRTAVQLIFCNKSEDDILMKPELDDLAKKHPQFTVHYVIDKAIDPAKWKGDVGYINKQIIKDHIAPPSADTLVFVCGPPGFYNVISGGKTPDYKQGELKGYLKELGYDENNVFKF